MVSPKSGPWWVLWVYVCMWFICAPKVFELCTSQLLFGLCRSLWIIELLVNLPNPHLGALAHSFTPKVLQVKECATTPTLLLLPSPLDLRWVHQGAWGASMPLSKFNHRWLKNLSYNLVATKKCSNPHSMMTPFQMVIESF
jgi:hypothetical protein